jgi:hypothetical protein
MRPEMKSSESTIKAPEQAIPEREQGVTLRAARVALITRPSLDR